MKLIKIVSHLQVYEKLYNITNSFLLNMSYIKILYVKYVYFSLYIFHPIYIHKYSLPVKESIL